MSLKGFHIVLISLSSLLALIFGGWSLAAYRATGGVDHLIFAIGSGLGAVGLAVYIVWFARRVRTLDEQDRERRKNIRPLVLGIIALTLSARPAAACSVCYGQASGPMIDGARMGVWVLLGVVLAVQICFAMFFLCLRRRDRQYRLAREDRPRKAIQGAVGRC